MQTESLKDKINNSFSVLLDMLELCNEAIKLNDVDARKTSWESVQKECNKLYEYLSSIKSSKINLSTQISKYLTDGCNNTEWLDVNKDMLEGIGDVLFTLEHIYKEGKTRITDLFTGLEVVDRLCDVGMNVPLEDGEI